MSSVTAPTPPARGESDAFGAAQAAAMIARGNSVVLAAPPSPAYAGPLLAAALGLAKDPEHPVLLLCPDAALDAWTAAATRAAGTGGKLVAAGPFAARAAHHLESGRIHLLLTSPAIAAELMRRSSLPLVRLSLLAVVWPEHEATDENLAMVLAEVPKETPRAVVTTDPAGQAGFIERYVWRAPVFGALSASDSSSGRCRMASVGWGDRIAALGAVADLLNRDELDVWTADDSHHGAIVEALAGHGVTTRLVTAVEPPDAAITVFFDLPVPERLARATPERVLCLVPPGAQAYLARTVERADPVALPSPMDAADRAIQADRRRIREQIETGIDRAAYATLAPLFDRWSGPEVATALQTLWTEARLAAPDPAAIPKPRSTTHPKVWIGVGRKDGATPAEIFALLTNDIGFTRDKLGRIELKDTFTLIEFTVEEDAVTAVELLAGRTIKKRRIAARLDRGRDPRKPSA